MSSTHTPETGPEPKETDPARHTPQDETPGLKPESTADAEGLTSHPVPDDPTTDAGYEDKPESTEEYEGPRVD